MKFAIALVAVLACVNLTFGHFHKAKLGHKYKAPKCEISSVVAEAPCIVEKPVAVPVPIKVKSKPVIVEKPIKVPVPVPVPVSCSAPKCAEPCATPKCAEPCATPKYVEPCASSYKVKSPGCFAGVISGL